MGPTSKYLRLDRDPIDGAPLNWRAHPDGFPTRQEHTTPFIERQRRAQATEVLYAQSKFFVLPDENAEYQKTIDWIANGNAIFQSEEKKVLESADPKKSQWLVWLVYFDVRGYIPTESELSAAMPIGARS